MRMLYTIPKWMSHNLPEKKKFCGVNLFVNININMVLLGFTWALLIGQTPKLLSEILRSTETTVETMNVNEDEAYSEQC